MKKNYIFTLLFALCFSVVSFGQGTETFTNSNATTSYDDGSYSGDNGVTWSYVQSRDADGTATNVTSLTTKALLLRRSSDDSKITSGTISGGIGDFSVKLYKGFTGGGDRQVELFINGVSRGTSVAFDDYNEHVFSISGINITGDFNIELKNTTGKQIIIDDIVWTAPSSDPSLSIISPLDNAVFDSTTSDVSISFNVSNFTLSGDNGSEMTDNTGDGYIYGTLEEVGETPESKNIFSTTESASVEPGKSYVITAELVDNSGNSLSPKVETTVSFSVQFPCDIQLETISTICVTETTDVDTYNVSIPFTGGNTSTYVLSADSGTIGGDDPSTSETGTITISNIAEGTDVEFTLVGDVTNSICDLTRNITSPTCLPAATCPQIGDIFITEIFQNPAAVSDSLGEYFEVYNSTDSSVDLQGWILKDTSSSSETHTIASSVVVPANGYAVLGVNTDTSTNGDIAVNYSYGNSYYLGNSADDIVLECGGNVIDIVEWDGGSVFPDPTGKSMELATNKYSATDNDAGVNWAESTTAIGTGGDFGTPGAVNSFVLGLVINQIEGFATYPNPVKNSRFTITTNSKDKKEVAIFNVLGKQVLSTSFAATKSNIDVSSIASGLYILKVTEGTKTATSKLVIK